LFVVAAAATTAATTAVVLVGAVDAGGQPGSQVESHSQVLLLIFPVGFQGCVFSCILKVVVLVLYPLIIQPTFEGPTLRSTYS
jgi:hypothetical protein